ncbi:hypothetical protein SUGI_0125620 [Cryptomeria japonica]|nr:hypothetical protein SUGI_0125620 [Cryptomeria japonica]
MHSMQYLVKKETNSYELHEVACSSSISYQQYLVNILEREKFREIFLCETVTNLVIPTFDIKMQFPIIFPSYEASDDPLKNPSLMDVRRSTTPAPTYFPSHQFTINSTNGESIESREFNLVYGGIAANNPTLMAMNLVIQESHRGTRIGDKKDFIVLSLGMGLEEVI